MARDDILAKATGFKLRRIGGHWWLRLFNKTGKNVGDHGPLAWAEVAGAQDELKAKGLLDIERDLGSRGK